MEETVKVYHLIMPECTLTFLTHDQRAEFIGNMHIGYLNDECVMCDSEVSTEEYDRLSKQRGAISG